MIVDRNGNTTIITQENASLQTLVSNIEKGHDTHKNDNLVVNLSSLDTILVEEITEFLRLSNTHKSLKKSFVIVTDKVDLDKIPSEIVVVPSLQEAFDLIEMEEIERDLGF